MRAGRRARALAGPLALAIAAGLAAAPARAELTYDIGLGAGIEVNDNLNLTPEPRREGDPEPVKKTIVVYSPVVGLAWEGVDDSLRLDYRGTYQDYLGGDDYASSFRHGLAAGLSWRRWRPFYLEVDDTYSVVPRFTDRPIEDVGNQLDSNRVGLRAGYAWDVNPTATVELGYSGDYQTYPGEADADTSLRHSGQMRYRKQFSPLWTGSATASYGRLSRELAADSTELTLGLNTARRWSERLDTSAHVSWLRQSDKAFEGEPAQSWDNLLFGFNASFQPTPATTLEAGAQQGIEELPEGDTATSRGGHLSASWRARLGSTLGARVHYDRREYRVAPHDETEWGPEANLRWVLAEWAAFDASAGWTKTSVSEEGLEDVEDDTWRAAASLSFRLGSRLSFTTGYRYQKADSTDEGRTYTNNVWHALLTLYFAPLPPGSLPEPFSSVPAPPATPPPAPDLPEQP